jgi:hypothetical protein
MRYGGILITDLDAFSELHERIANSLRAQGLRSHALDAAIALEVVLAMTGLDDECEHVLH